MMKYTHIHYGNWDDCKYAVLIPFDSISNDKIGYANSVDTFSMGSIHLPKDAWILCPRDEAKNVKYYNPNVHVLGYEGDRALGYPQPFLTQLGYRAEDAGQYSWNDRESLRTI